MNDSITRISLDVHDAGSSVSIHAKRGDTGRVIIVSLVDGGVPYVITKDCTAVFTGKKPDGNVLYNDCTISQNTIIYAFTDNTVAAAGRINCEIKLYGSDGKLITSPKFTINVQDTVYNEGDEIESTDEFNALTVLVTEATEAIQNANQVAEELEEARDKGEFNGPPGEQGPKGDKGDPGDKGDKGDPGSALIDDGAVRGDAAWSSLNTIDKLCPSFEKTGTLVQCEPVEGYPIEVTSKGAVDSLSVSVCGKNLYNAGDYRLEPNTIIRFEIGSAGTSSTFAGTIEYIPVSHLRGKTISIRRSPQSTNGSTGAGLAFYDINKEHIKNGSTRHTPTTVPDNASFMRFSINKDYVGEAQIELGEVVTDYEPYCGNSSNAAGSKGTVTGVKGINNVFAYSGDNAVEITVSGKADPVAIIEKLTNAVISLGGNL